MVALDELKVHQPMIALPHDQLYQRPLADGYTLRWGDERDHDSIADLYARVFGDEVESGVNHYVANYGRRVLSAEHPLGGARDVAVVVDAQQKVVSAALLMRMPLEYAGVALAGGRPEIVATDPAVRNRGYIREIFALLHARSDARGDVLQGITGIPYYYRQFGYEYAITLGGGRMYPFQAIPELPPERTEPFVIRAATTADIMQLLMLYERERMRQSGHLPMLVTSKIDAAYMRYAIAPTTAHEPWVPMVITQPHNGDVVGTFWTHRVRNTEHIGVWALSTEPHVSLHSVFPSVVRYLRQAAHESIPTVDGRTPAAKSIYFGLGVDHPVYQIIQQHMHRVNRPYAWYVRVPDLPRLIGQIAVPLERRLAQSTYAGYTGEIALDFYRSGIILACTNGKIQAREWHKSQEQRSAQAGYPPHVILQQIFGMHSIYELKLHHADVWSQVETEDILNVLFPKQASWLAPLD